jgi:hypothetical protein
MRLSTNVFALLLRPFHAISKASAMCGRISERCCGEMKYVVSRTIRRFEALVTPCAIAQFGRSNPFVSSGSISTQSDGTSAVREVVHGTTSTFVNSGAKRSEASTTMPGLNLFASFGKASPPVHPENLARLHERSPPTVPSYGALPSSTSGSRSYISTFSPARREA